MDYWDLTRNGRSLRSVLRQTKAPFFLASFTSDWLYPPSDSERIVEALQDADRDVTYHALESPLGHDAFLLEYEMLTPLLEDALDRVNK